MISVIVPVYNVEEYLPACLESIKRQTFKDYEVILVDDGSPDNSGRICDEYVDKNINWRVIHQENGGLSSARNSGLNVAKGEYICFVDSDDTVDDNYLLFLYHALVDSQADIGICGYQRILCSEDVQSTREVEKSVLCQDELWQEVFGNLNNSSCNKIYRRKLIGNIRFMDGLYHGEDLMFNLAYIINCSRAVMIDTPLYHYWKHKGSVTRSGYTDRRNMEIIAKDVAEEFIHNHYPKMSMVAGKYCFRARMNVIRAMVMAKKEKEYSDKLQEYRCYIEEKYGIIRSQLKLKERIEYHLFNKCFGLYCVIICHFLDRGN